MTRTNSFFFVALVFAAALQGCAWMQTYDSLSQEADTASSDNKSVDVRHFGGDIEADTNTDADEDTDSHPPTAEESDNDGDGYAEVDGDCDDDYADVNPGAEEICDGKDNDCDGAVDEGCPTGGESDADTDADADTDTDADADTDSDTDADSDADTDSDTDSDTDADSDADSDADADADTGTMPVDADGDGYDEDSDCDDGDASVNPGATEICDEFDNDCDGKVDEGVITTWYYDDDGDGYGNSDNTEDACSAPSEFVADATDCDDGDASVNPGATEVCDEIDNDCDGSTDEGLTTTFYADADEDGYGDPADSINACEEPSGYTDDATDCDDGDENINPDAEEECDEIDNDCDGSTDEDDVCVETVEVCWSIAGGFDGGELWIWDSSSLSWAVFASVAKDGVDDTQMCGEITAGSGDAIVLQGWYYWSGSSMTSWIATNVGDPDGDGVYSFAVEGTWTADGVTITVTAVSYDGDGDGKSTGRYDGAYGYAVMP